jgi:hypothetical protein
MTASRRWHGFSRGMASAVVLWVAACDFCTTQYNNGACTTSWFCGNPYYYYNSDNLWICQSACSAPSNEHCVHGCVWMGSTCVACTTYCAGYCTTGAECIASCAEGTSSATPAECVTTLTERRRHGRLASWCNDGLWCIERFRLFS